MNRTLPAGWDEDLPVFTPRDGPVATRSASGAALNALAEKIPALMGGSADLAPSNKTIIQSSHDFQKESTDGRNIRFGVREHAMAGILSGMALHKGIIPYGGTFLVFADYMRPAMRCACLMNLPVIYVFTHDSISVGEDGPTHQPVEHLAGLRLMPGMTVIRPADANETVVAWKVALRLQSPAALILSRQKLPVIDRTNAAGPEGVEKGAYVVSEATGPVELIIMATGAEVHDALAAQTILAERGVSARVVNMPSWELFEQQTESYKQSVLPPGGTPRLAVEAGVGFGWERYIGDRGETICMTTYGASAPGAVLREAYGFTPDHIAARARALVERG
jgi:transketolase